ncbi:putative Acyltransferase 3 domain-containing protein [Seiridium cardinale]
MSQQVSEVLNKMRSVFKMSDISYHQLPQDASQQRNLDDQGQEDTEKQSRPPPLRWYWCLLPWPLAVVLGKTTRKLPKRTSTSYLNGVRGIACMIVYTQHVNVHYYREFVSNPYGADPPENNHGISQIPIIRVMYAGKGMVAIFFVLSGFVLTYSPLRKIASLSAQRDDSQYDITRPMCRFIIHNIRRGSDHWSMFLYTPPWHSSLHAHARGGMHVLSSDLELSFVLSRELAGGQPDILPTRLALRRHYTTMEYRGSIVVFLMCMATAQLTTRARKIIILGMAIWALYWVHGDMFAFLTGMFLAELRSCPLSDDLIFIRKIPQRVTEVLSICVLLSALMLMGWPENGDKGVEPFKTMSLLIPTGWRATDEMVTFFWSYTTAPVIMAALENLPSAQWLLSTKPILYLGEISFSFYLLHWMGFLWPGWEMMARMVNVLHWPMDWSFYLMYFTILAMLVVSADVFWRLIDENDHEGLPHTFSAYETVYLYSLTSIPALNSDLLKLSPPKTNSNVLGYERGEIPVKGAVTAEIIVAGLGVPLQAFIDGQYLDSKIMSERPGMYLKYLPYQYDAVTGKLVSGGSYLFETWESAKDYVSWANEDFQVGDPKVSFWDQPMFESHNGRVWKVIGAHNFASVEENAVARLQQWTCQAANIETSLRQAYPSIRRAAEAEGAASIWLLYSPEENVVGIQLGFKKDGASEPEYARQYLANIKKLPPIEQHLPKTLGLSKIFDRTSILLTLWLPKSRVAGGSELAIPYHPMVPDITHDHL